LLVHDNRDVGIVAQASEMVVSDAIVGGMREQTGDGMGGRGLSVQEGSRLEASRLLVHDNREVGVYVFESEVVFDDSVVRGTRELASDGTRGGGFSVQDGSRLVASRLLVDDNRDIGVAVLASEVVVMDAIVRGTGERASDGKSGRGLIIQDGSRLDASRLLVDDNRQVGVFAVLGSEVAVTDVVVRGTRPEEGDGRRGYGVLAQDSASLSGTRVSIEGAHELGMVALSAGTIDFTSVTVANVELSASGVPRYLAGHAVSAIDATVRLSDFHIHDAATCGVLVARSGAITTTAPPALDLSRGVVERTSIGACVQVDGYDTTRLQHEVEYRDNGKNLDATSLPVPEPVSTAEL
jgi:hypothetical protein